MDGNAPNFKRPNKIAIPKPTTMNNSNEYKLILEMILNQISRGSVGRYLSFFLLLNNLTIKSLTLLIRVYHIIFFPILTLSKIS